MKMTPLLPFGSLLVMSATLAACASSEGKHPELFSGELEQRIQGTFSGPTNASTALRPTPLAITSAEDIRTALSTAQAQHLEFLRQAENVRPLIDSAVGLGPDENSWSLAQIEIAELESRSGDTLSLLAGLDSLYADATLAFSEREQIDAAREQVSDLLAIERQVIAEFLSLISTVSRPDQK